MDWARRMLGGESPAMVRMFRDQTRVTFPLGFDSDDTYRNFRVGKAISPFPLDVIIDRKGRVAYISRRYDLDSLKTTIERLLAE